MNFHIWTFHIQNTIISVSKYIFSDSIYVWLKTSEHLLFGSQSWNCLPFNLAGRDPEIFDSPRWGFDSCLCPESKKISRSLKFSCSCQFIFKIATDYTFFFPPFGKFPYALLEKDEFCISTHLNALFSSFPLLIVIRKKSQHFPGVDIWFVFQQ